MNYSKIEQEVEEFVRNAYTSSPKQFPYHNLYHTVEVVKDAADIGVYYLLSAPELFIVKVAAWFHDIGHLTGDIPEHEERGVGIMRECMSSMNLSETFISSMASCIMATKYPCHPHSLYEEILCDADTFHFGTSLFKDTDVLVRKEMELRMGKTIADWHVKSIKLLEEHYFFTKYCQEMLDAGKQENIRWLKKFSC